MLLVSVIIPVYNSERFLRQCLDSVVNQTLRDIEVICVNDGSTDNSLKILEEYSGVDKRIRVYTKSNEGKGAASARNLGLENACGKYLMFLDSDDFFELDMLESLTARAEETDSDVVICGAKRFDNLTQKVSGFYTSIKLELAPQMPSFSYKDCKRDIFQISDVIAWNKLFKKSLIHKYNLRFEPINISDEQYVSCVSLVLAERITVVDKKLVNYRYNTNTSQCDFRTKHPEAAYMAIWSIVDAFKKYGVFEDIKQSYYNIILPGMRVYYDAMDDYSTFVSLHNKLKCEVFAALGIAELPREYFADKYLYKWCKAVLENEPGELAFNAVKVYGKDITSASLRFKIPCALMKKISPGSRVVIYGAGIVGKFYYTQLIFSDFCKIVLWTGSKKDMYINNCAYEAEYILTIDYDYVLVAYPTELQIEMAIKDLINLGIPSDKIIYSKED